MFRWVRTKLQERQELKDWYDKARLCQPCEEACGDQICRRIGCMNMDMRANSLRLKVLLKRLDDATPPKLKTNDCKVINLNDYR